MFFFSARTPNEFPLDVPLKDIKRLARLLLIEDQVETFPLERLRDEGYAIDHWTEVKSLKRLEEREFDVIILDIHGVAEDWAPADGGLAVLRHLKEHVPDVAVIAFSGQTFKLERHQFFSLADDVLSKPADAVKCKSVIDHVLKRHFKPSRIWEVMREVLRKQGQSERSLQKLERGIARALAGDPRSLGTKVEKLAPYIKTSATAATLLQKLIALAHAISPT